MEQQKARKKIIFWLRFSGWFCLIPASAWLLVIQTAKQMGLADYTLWFGIELGIIVLFAVYLLTTANNVRWQQPRNLMLLAIFALIFISLIVFISLCFAYNACCKMNKQPPDR
ncbi:hypothetical protein OZY43_07855 [Lactobacillus sp. ESL0785]|uniref:hypothetical protein n=1 Tax=Lactobacillus sp. ESL0785 TaxID=2983232 RepID=UPI0023F81786|nr:hypothetical protein [Lactobacillus sp. ESL0785]WEV70839.1 hypothetical protein OZY43_07855 [Lactobacillus sp. ESL0785]